MPHFPAVDDGAEPDEAWSFEMSSTSAFAQSASSLTRPAEPNHHVQGLQPSSALAQATYHYSLDKRMSRVDRRTSNIYDSPYEIRQTMY